MTDYSAMASSVMKWASVGAFRSELVGMVGMSALSGVGLACGWLCGNSSGGGFIMAGSIGVLGGFAHHSYTQFDMYTFGTTAFCTMASLGALYNINSGRNADKKVPSIANLPCAAAGALLGAGFQDFVQATIGYFGR